MIFFFFIFLMARVKARFFPLSIQSDVWRHSNRIAILTQILFSCSISLRHFSYCFRFEHLRPLWLVSMQYSTRDICYWPWLWYFTNEARTRSIPLQISGMNKKKLKLIMSFCVDFYGTALIICRLFISMTFGSFLGHFVQHPSSAFRAI